MAARQRQNPGRAKIGDAGYRASGERNECTTGEQILEGKEAVAENASAPAATHPTEAVPRRNPRPPAPAQLQPQSLFPLQLLLRLLLRRSISGACGEACHHTGSPTSCAANGMDGLGDTDSGIITAGAAITQDQAGQIYSEADAVKAGYPLPRKIRSRSRNALKPKEKAK